WHLMTWDLQNDSYEAFTGTDELAADWRFDSFIIRHQNTDNDPSAAPQAWSGDIYFDSMEFNKFDSEAVRNAKIDDITISSGAVGTIDANAIRVYRSGNTINVAAPTAINAIDVYNAAGTKVASAAPATGTTAINISDFARGLYIVNVKAGKATKSVKIVK
ncbi:MAG: T9SS type A sorting domain-containing protein, partial [Bacteroidales bacterium]|nr:T9SS type A sorting domain-containing protein [Bacteroidales bacterium]